MIKQLLCKHTQNRLPDKKTWLPSGTLAATRTTRTMFIAAVLSDGERTPIEMNRNEKCAERRRYYSVLFCGRFYARPGWSRKTRCPQSANGISNLGTFRQKWFMRSLIMVSSRKTATATLVRFEFETLTRTTIRRQVFVARVSSAAFHGRKIDGRTLLEFIRVNFNYDWIRNTITTKNNRSLIRHFTRPNGV